MTKNIRVLIILLAAIVGALVGFFAVTYRGQDGGGAVFWGGLLGGWLGSLICDWADAD